MTKLFKEKIGGTIMHDETDANEVREKVRRLTIEVWKGMINMSDKGTIDYGRLREAGDKLAEVHRLEDTYPEFNLRTTINEAMDDVACGRV